MPTVNSAIKYLFVFAQMAPSSCTWKCREAKCTLLIVRHLLRFCSLKIWDFVLLLRLDCS